MKIPIPLGILLTIIVVGAVIAGTESYFRVATVASGSIQPQEVQITNISDTTFSVSWTTESEATGGIAITSSSLKNRVIFDEQDVSSQGKYTTHSVTFRNATAQTDYQVTILSNGKKHLDEGKPFLVRTAPKLTSVSGDLDPAYGTIVTTDNTPVAGALVYLTIEGGQPLSTITKPSGTWLIPLNLVRTTDLTGYLPTTERMTETIIVRKDKAETSALTDTLNDSPVPDMSLGTTYDFRRLNAQTPGEPVALRPTPAGQPSAVLGKSTTATGTFTLSIPAEGAALPTTLPLISGTGVPGKTVSIVLGITNPIGGTAIVASDGQWSFTPPRAVSPGKQSVTATSLDKSNKPVAITHMFEILKSGTQVLGDATPSATLTPTATPTATLAATESAEEESTLAAEEVPTSGYELPTIMLLLLGIGLLTGGVLLRY